MHNHGARRTAIVAVGLLSVAWQVRAQQLPTPPYGEANPNTALAGFRYQVLDDPIAGGQLVLGYTLGTQLVEDQYVAFVLCNELDGHVSLWAATGQAESGALSLESEWGVEMTPAYDNCPDFASAVDDWFVQHGYPPSGATWHLITQADTIGEVGDWMSGAGGEWMVAWPDAWDWLWQLLCQLLIGGCDQIAPEYPNDGDGDGVPNDEDNCPGAANASQSDTDGDGQGDACDGDIDGDGVPNDADNCPGAANPDQANPDGDDQGSACDTDDDNDDVPDNQDNCADVANPDQTNTDGDAEGDACDSDDDGDGVPDEDDNCPTASNPSQIDTDEDGLGNNCDADIDGDGTPNGADDDIDGDGVVNGSDPDVDGDGVPNAQDSDVDGDGIPNAEDADVDGDGVPNGEDSDVDGDGTPNGQDSDVDGDGLSNGADNDVDGDGVRNGSDSDVDGDGLTNEQDGDVDGDGIQNGQDNDIDGDGTDNDEDEDDDADGEEDEDEDNGGCGEPGDCELELELLAAWFYSGPIQSWDTNTPLSPPPGGWHYNIEYGGCLYPVVSSFGSLVPMYVRLGVLSATPACDQVTVKAYMGAALLASGSFTAGDNTPYEFEMWLEPHDTLPNATAVGDLEAGIGRTVDFEFCVEARGVYEQYCAFFGAALPTHWYVMPSQNGLVPANERYDLGLDKVVQYARGASSHESIARRINAGVAAELCYDPGEYPPGGHILNAYSTQGGVPCGAHADLLRYLCRTAGISAARLCTWAGLSSWVYYYYVQGYENYESRVSFQLRAPANDVAEENPHFYHHVVTQVAGITCDPSYGATWLPQAIEWCGDAIQQTGPSVPSWNEYVCGWVCDHTFGPLGSCPP